MRQAACLALILAGAVPAAAGPLALRGDARAPDRGDGPAGTVWVLQSVEARVYEAGNGERVESLGPGAGGVSGNGAAEIPSGGRLSASLNVQLHVPRELRAEASDSPAIGADASAGTSGISQTLFPHAEFRVANGSCPERPLQSERGIGNRTVSFASPSGGCPLDTARLGERFTWTMTAGVTVYGPLYPNPDGADGVGVTVRAVYASTYSLMVDAEPSELPRNVATPAFSTITITVRDPQGLPIAGDPISLGLDPPGLGRLSATGGATDAAGRLQVRYQAPLEAELGGHDQVRVLARDGRYGLEGFASLRFGQTRVTLAAEPAELAVQAEPAYATLRATVLRGNGQPRAGANLRFRLEPPALGALAVSQATTDAQGQASLRYRAPNAAEYRATPRDHVVVHVSDTSDKVEAELLIPLRGLRVVGSNPVQDQRDVAQRFLTGEAEVGIVFDQPLDPASLGPLTATVETLRHGRRSAELRVADSALWLRLAGSPSDALGLKVSVRLAAGEGGILSQRGSPLLFPYELGFQTVPTLRPRLIVSQVVDDPRVDGRVTVAAKPFVVRVDGGLDEDTELDEALTNVTLLGPGASGSLAHAFYPGLRGPRVPPAAEAKGNTANFAVRGGLAPGSYGYTAVIEPAGDRSQPFTARADVTVNSYPLGAVWTSHRPRIMVYPVVDEAVLPRSAWSSHVLRVSEEWAGQAAPAAARLLPVRGLDVRINPPADLSCSALTCPARFIPGLFSWVWYDYLAHWSRRIGRAGWLLPADVVEVGLLPPGSLANILEQLLLDTQRGDFSQYHDAAAWRLWSAPGMTVPLLEPETAGSAAATNRWLHALGDAEGLPHAFRWVESFSGYDTERDHVVAADGVTSYGARQSIMNAHFGDPLRWMTNAQYEAFLRRWSAPPRGVLAGGPAGAPRQQPAEGPALGVSGLIDVAGGREAAYLDPLVAFEGPPTLAAGGAGDYAVELADAAGQPLGRYPFQPAFSPTEAGQRASFLVAVPRPAGLAAVRVVRGAAELGSRRRSANPPVATFTRPVAGQTLTGEAAVQWSAADADGDALSFSLLYSADAGVTWQVLQADTTATTLSLDTRLLPNGPEGRLRLLANDGFDAGEAQLALGLANPLAVLSTSPGPGETEVSPRTAIEIRLRDPLDPATVSGSTFRLLDERGRPVAGDVAYDAPGGVAIFVPAADLPAFAAFQARLTTGARTPDGRSLAADHVWSFTTRARSRLHAPLLAKGWDRQRGRPPATLAPTPSRVVPFPTEAPTARPSPSPSASRTPTPLPPTDPATAPPSTTASPTASPLPTATSSPTAPATATTAPAPSLALEAAFTTDGAGALRMAFVSLDDLQLALRVHNGGPAPATAALRYEVRDPEGELVGLLSSTTEESLPPGPTTWPLARSLPTDLARGLYTFTGTLVAGGEPQSRSAVFYVAARLHAADDFANPASGWAMDDTAEYASGYAGGEYRILRRTPGGSSRYGPGTRMGDVVLEADARLLDAANAAYGLVLGTSDDGGRYTAFLVHPGGSFLVDRYSGGAWSELRSWADSPALRTGTSANHLMALRRGSQLTVFANGQELATLTDSQLPAAGWQGLLANAWDPPAEARFDNFRAYDP